MKDIIKRIVVAILTFEAQLVLKKYRPKIVAITGSVGKTSTKDAIYTVLNKEYFTWRSKKSFNSEFGVPLTILDSPTGWNNPLIWLGNILKGISLLVFKHPYPEWLVLEVGADRPGDIARVAEWLPIDIAVITRIGDIPVHVEFYESVEDVAKEKSQLINGLKEKGVLVLNADDERVHAFREKAQGRTTRTYGTQESVDMQAKDIELSYNDGKPAGLVFTLIHNTQTHTVSLPHILGGHHAYTALAALTVATEAGIELEKAVTHIAGYMPPPGRLRLIEGLKNTSIIDDSYNAAPVAMEAGLETLGAMHTDGRRIAILGDMLELGDYTVEAHKHIGQKAAGVCDYLFIVGPRARYIAEGALLGGMSEKNIREFDDAREAGKHVEHLLKTGDIVLVKGSQGIRTEKAVEEIMAHPENKRSLLVRQEKEWMER